MTPPDSAGFTESLRSAILRAAGVIFITAFLLVLMLLMMLRVMKWSEHSYEVITQIYVCENQIIDAQDAVRGYLLSGDPAFPASFTNVHGRVDQAFNRLLELIPNRSDQKMRAQDLVRAKDGWFEHMNTLVDRREKGFPADTDWISRGDDLMGSLRAKFEVFTHEEENLHAQRITHVSHVKRALIFAGGGLVLILILTVGQLVRRQFMDLAAAYRSALTTIEHRHAALVRSEADLEEQKEWFRVTLTSIGDAVMVTDREGRIVFMNHEAERLTGWSSVGALLKPLSSVFRIIQEDTRVRAEDPSANVFREGRVMKLANHVVLISQNGDEWPIEDSAAPIYDAAKNILGVVLVFHDATDLRRNEKALRSHSEELEKRVAERTTALQQTVSELEAFSYTVSHDLRSPLRAMQGFAQAVLEDYGDKLDHQGKNYLDRIKTAAERLDRLIRDLLSYTRVSRQEAKAVPVDLGAILADILENYPHLQPPDVVMEVIGALPRVLGQESSLTQVLSNILGNAVKFVPPGTVPHIRLWSEDLGSRVRLSIQDNGIGVAPEDRERIFQMFVQVDESRSYGGTGVGLAIVKKAIESMHGSVGLDSPDEGGTRFWVELDKADA